MLRQQGKLSGRDNKSPPLARMIDWTTAPKLDSKMKRRAHGVRRRATDVLHSEETEKFTEEMALTSVKDTFATVKTLSGQLPWRRKDQDEMGNYAALSRPEPTKNSRSTSR